MSRDPSSPPFFVISTFTDLAQFHCETKFLITTPPPHLSPLQPFKRSKHTITSARFFLSSLGRLPPATDVEIYRSRNFLTDETEQRSSPCRYVLSSTRSTEVRPQSTTEGPINQEAEVLVSVLPSTSSRWTFVGKFLNVRQYLVEYDLQEEANRSFFSISVELSVDRHTIAEKILCERRCDLYREQASSTIQRV